MNILNKNKILILLHFLYPLGRRFFTFEIFSYLIVGAVNTSFNILIFWILYNFIIPQNQFSCFRISIASQTLCLFLAFAASIPTGYWLNKNFAFMTGSDSSLDNLRFKRYIYVVSQGLLLDYLIFTFSIHVLSLDPNLAKCVSTAVVVAINYLLQKHFTFRK